MEGTFRFIKATNNEVAPPLKRNRIAGRGFRHDRGSTPDRSPGSAGCVPWFHDRPGLIGDAIAGKKPALDKLRSNVGNLKKFRFRKE
jgi:hypothetical protein